MASAKFLEEALSTDVDESAVNAIVGSLETQLVTSTPVSAISQTGTTTISHQNNQLTGNSISNGGTISAIQTLKHGVANGGGGNVSVNSLMNQELSKSIITTSTLVPVNVVTSNAITQHTTNQQHQQHQQQQQQQQQHQHQQQQQQQQQQQHQHTQSSGIVSGTPTTYINQSATNQVTTNQTQIANLAKSHESVKIIYPSTGQVVAAGVVNNKISFPAQTVAQLANGTLGVVTSQAVLQTTSNVVTNVGSGTQTGCQSIGTNVNKQSGTALVIKTSGAPSGMVSVPMSVPVSVAGNVANTTLHSTLQGKGGMASTIVPSNVQILNVNTMRPATPMGPSVGKQVASRVVIGQHIVGTRPGGPGQITLQTLHGLQPGAQGHLIVKTENGQYQLLRVGPAPTAGTPGGATVTPNSIAGNAAVVGQNAGTTTYRLASVPAVSRLNTQFTGPPLTTLRKPVQTVAANATTPTVVATPSTVTATPTTTVTPPTTAVQTVHTPAQRQTTDNTKEKCRRFLANLLELSSREPKAVERNVRTLIQELIDTKVEPEEFCDRLERLLNASPQPCLIGFLKKSLPLLRQSLVTKELVIEGIKPPPANVVFSIASVTPTIQQNQLRPAVAVAPTQIPVVASSMVQTPVRVMAPPVAATPTVVRPPQPVPQRLIRPVTTIVRTPATYGIKSTVAIAGMRQPAPHIQHKATAAAAAAAAATAASSSPLPVPIPSPLPTPAQQAPPQPQPPPPPPPVIPTTIITTTTTAVVKTTATSTLSKTVNTATTINKTIVPSLVPKPTAKEKEKKTFSSAGYTGDDDINDVAAMGGVNLAEESQRILGSTEFVGTQIRSCKDEVFLHLTPLQQRIKQIVTSYGLEEPNQEVAALISHATQERLKNLVEKLAVIAEHRIDLIKVDPRYEVTQDVRAQLKFLEELDRVERRRHEEQERELLLRAAKSRAKTEDPEQAKLKAKAKEMQRAEMEELRQREANLTALQAIGPRKKPKLDVTGSSSSQGGSSGGQNASSSGVNRQLPMRPRLKRVNFRDLLFLLEQEKETCRSTTLYKSYLK